MTSSLLRSSVRAMVLCGVVLCLRAPAQLPAGTTDASSSQQGADTRGEELRSQAAAAIERNDMPAALAALAALKSREPENAGILFNLGSAQEALDQFSNAEASYRHAIRLKSDYLEPHLALGLLLARTHRAAEARTELLAATATVSDAPVLKARAFRALAELDRDDQPEAAREALLSALKLTPETPEDALLSASLAQKSGDGAAAEKAYRRAIAASPHDAAAITDLARLLTKSDRAGEARSVLESGLQANAGDPQISAELASLLARSGDVARARDLMATAHAAHPAEASITRLYARLLSEAGDFAGAEQMFASLGSPESSDPELADDRADALIHLKRFPEAEELLKGALRVPGAFPSRESMVAAAGHLAFAATQNNDPQTVLQALAQRATVLPQSPATVFLEATARDKLHQNKQAIALYRQFLSVAESKFPDETWEARHRLIALEHTR